MTETADFASGENAHEVALRAAVRVAVDAFSAQPLTNPASADPEY